MSTPNTSLVKWVPDHHLENAREDCGEYPGEVEAIPGIALDDLTALVEGLREEFRQYERTLLEARAGMTEEQLCGAAIALHWVKKHIKAQLEAHRKEG